MARTKILKSDLSATVQSLLTDVENAEVKNGSAITLQARFEALENQHVEQAVSFEEVSNAAPNSSPHTYSNIDDRLNQIETIANASFDETDGIRVFTSIDSAATKQNGFAYSSFLSRLNNIETLLNISYNAGSDTINAKSFEEDTNASVKTSPYAYDSLDARLNNIETLTNSSKNELNGLVSYDSSVTASATASALYGSIAARLNNIEKMIRSSYADTYLNYKVYDDSATLDATQTNYSNAISRFNMIEKIAKNAYNNTSSINVGLASDRMDFTSNASVHAKLNYVNETEAGTFTEVIAYDADGNVSSLTVKNSSNNTISVTTFTYTSGNLTGSSKALKDPSTGTTYRTIAKTYTYDANGNVTQITTTTT